MTRHHKRANHSWLRYCSQEIIGLAAARLLERVSISFGEIETLQSGYFLRGLEQSSCGEVPLPPPLNRDCLGSSHRLFAALANSCDREERKPNVNSGEAGFTRKKGANAAA